MEFVYVVPRARLFPECYPQGLVPFGKTLPMERFEESVREAGYFVEREHAEHDPTLKQVIPYTVVVQRGGEEGVLLLRRTKAGGEQRLHDKLSIGVGGHINPVDLEERSEGGRRDLVSRATHRELEEEIEIRGATTLRSVGILNDDSNPVGAVHVGLVQTLVVEGSVSVREREVLEGSLKTPAELSALRQSGANFETWSELLVERIDEVLAPTLLALT